MKNIIIKNNKGPAPYEAEGFRSGFVILFAVTVSSIILAVALGALKIALKELKFSTSAKDSNDAFLAADTGVEYVLLRDKPPSTAYSLGVTVEVVGSLGSSSAGCAKVTITKTNFVDTDGVTYVRTNIVSKGYNVGNPTTCESNSSNRIERELLVNY